VSEKKAMLRIRGVRYVLKGWGKSLRGGIYSQVSFALSFRTVEQVARRGRVG